MEALTGTAKTGTTDGGTLTDPIEVAQDRDVRQSQVVSWGIGCFTKEQMDSIPQRGLRFGEEAIELLQSIDMSEDDVHFIVSYVFNRKKGTPFQELGGSCVTLLALAAALGYSLEQAEIHEITRVLSKPKEFFAKRNAEKNAAGLIATDLKGTK